MYLKELEASNLLLGIKKLGMSLDSEVSKKPLVTILFSTLVSNRVKKKEEPKGKPEPIVPPEVSSPFYPEAKPYDRRLPGDHQLSMVVWKGGVPVALIDGKMVKEGSVLDNKTVTKIESDGVWFSEDGVKYYLGIEE